MLTLPFPDQPVGRRNINADFMAGRRAGGRVLQPPGHGQGSSQGSSPASTTAIFRHRQFFSVIFFSFLLQDFFLNLFTEIFEKQRNFSGKIL